MPAKLVSVVLFRSPVPTSQGTDPWHDAFGPFCLPSFPLSALESGTSSPLAPVALTASGLPSRKPRPAPTNPMLTTHHLHLTAHPPSDSAIDDDAVSLAESIDSESSASPSLAGSQANVPSSRTRKESVLRRPSIEPTEFAVTSIPVLASITCNHSPLVGACLNHQWAGVVCTSQRAVQAWGEALTSIAHNAVRDYERLDFDRRPNELRLPRTQTTWTRVPFFAVGPATSTALKKIVIGPPAGSKVSPTAVAAATAPIKPKVVLGGKSTGNADLLGRFILNFFDCQPGEDDSAPPSTSDHASSNASSASQPESGRSSPQAQSYALNHPLLVLQGDKALPTLPRILSSARPQPIPFETMRVYETGVDPNFSSNVDSLRTMLARARGIALSRRGSGRSSRRPSGNWNSSNDGLPGPRRGSTSSLSMNPITAGGAGGGIGAMSTIKDIPPHAEPSISRRTSFNTDASSVNEDAGKKLAAGEDEGDSTSGPVTSPSQTTISTSMSSSSGDTTQSSNTTATATTSPPASANSSEKPASTSHSRTSTTNRDSWSVNGTNLSTEDISKLNARQQVRAIAAARRAARNAREWKAEADKAAAAVAAKLSLEDSKTPSGSQQEVAISDDPVASASGAASGGVSATGLVADVVGTQSPGRMAGSALSSAMPSPKLPPHGGSAASGALAAGTSLQHAPSVAAVRPDWLVFFSPSGVLYALETLRKQEWLPPAGGADADGARTAKSTITAERGGPAPGAAGKPRSYSSNSSVHPRSAALFGSPSLGYRPSPQSSNANTAAPLQYPRIATLGPTTARWIIEHLGHEGVQVDVVAAKPSPECLKEAICAFEVSSARDGATWTLEAHGLHEVVPGAAVLGGSGVVAEDDR
ncbi:uroporphyrinogen-III synthase [Tilletia horrida]|uniref:Uroporphyrinogen-III synthase n=1 Tax=Tilletia horrida TaxID=155126 RepID=A0AAN6GEU5_9BASI|nr:uroporphyrinogen-III synthase [Tilletia horrida]KAK0566488.1 uroporphyrinogen-III synthase [Tilletia horrida]